MSDDAVLQPGSGITPWRWMPGWAWMALCIAIPALLLTVYILINGLGLPVMDEWGLTAPIAYRTASGQLPSVEFFAQNDVHRQATLRLTTWTLTLLNGWNLITAMLITVLVAALITLLLIRLVGRQSRGMALVLALPIAALILTGRGGSSWLWALVVVYMWLNLALVAGLLVVYPRITTRRVVIAALLGFVALYSTIAGIWYWPALVLALWLQGDRDRQHYAILAGVALAAYGTYFWNFAPVIPESNPVGHDLAHIFQFGLAYLGASFTHDWRVAPWVGGVGLLLLALNAAYWLWRQPSRKAELGPWLALALFALGGAALTAMGRVFLTLEGALTSRYVLTGSLFWVALVVVSVKTATIPLKQGGSWAIALVNGVVLIALIPIYGIAAWLGFTQLSYVERHYETCAANYAWKLDTDCLGEGLTDLHMHAMAAYNLALYLGDETAILPTAAAGSRVIMLGQHPWQHTTVALDTPRGVMRFLEQDVFHILAPPSDWLFPVNSPVFAQVAETSDPDLAARLSVFLQDAELVVVLRTPDTVDWDMLDALLSDFNATPLEAPEALFPIITSYRRGSP